MNQASDQQAHNLTYDQLTRAYESLMKARRALMLPGRSSVDEVTALTTAFHECQLGLPRDTDIQYEPARQWIKIIRDAMDTSQIKVEDGYDRFHGSLWLRVEELLKCREGRSKSRKTPGFRQKFCDALDELANWVSNELERASYVSTHAGHQR